MIVLKKYQERVRDAICEIVVDTAQKIADASSSRAAISAAQGAILLEAPTASGKTVTLARSLALLKTRLPAKCVWFWFAPYSDLVTQTFEAFQIDCPEVVARDPRTDREIALCQDGDVFIATWATVSAAKKEQRKIRQDAESVPSIDAFVQRLRDDGWYVGAVVDEAHRNFNTAKQARAFYLSVLKPDFTIMATATPDDADIEEFCHITGIGTPNRLRVSRLDVVDANLNKYGVKAYYFRASDEDKALLDYDEVAIYAATQRHNEVKAALQAKGINLTPLLLVQVENLSMSLELAKKTLVAAGIRPDAIAVHTSDEPDRALRTIAYDESKEALVFKLAVEAGFDAPRAWTLVTLRTTRSVTSGLQVIGRIMRVHSKLQKEQLRRDLLLDFGHVFLSDSASQSGLTEAAAKIKALSSEIQAVTDHVQVVEFSGGKIAITDPAGGFLEALVPGWRPTSAGGQEGDGEGTSIEPETDAGTFAANLFGTVESLESRVTVPLSAFGGVKPRGAAVHVNNGEFRYAMRSDLPLPTSLLREEFTGSPDDLVKAIAERIPFDERITSLVLKSKGQVEVTEEDLFEKIKALSKRAFAFSRERIEDAAQLAFNFNDSLDRRDIKAALVGRLRSELDALGADIPSEAILRRTVDLALYLYPNMLRDTCKECMSLVLEVKEADPIPKAIYSDEPLDPSRKGAYAVFGERMRDWETRFARVLDGDDGGTVLWWLKNVENTRWACKIVRPNGRNYFPDFIIGVAGRKRPDNIALAEVKYDIHSDASIEKVRTDHLKYGSALMVTWDELKRKWYVVGYRQEIDRNDLLREFKISDLVLL